MKLNLKTTIFLLVGGFGIWLIYWDYVDQANAWLHSQGISPLIIGILIVISVGALGVRVLR